MKKYWLLWFLVYGMTLHAQKSDFKHIDFTKADNTAKRLQYKELKEVNKLTYQLTDGLKSDVEKLRSIYMWITHNIANDHRLFLKNKRKRNKYAEDSLALATWNSTFKKLLFKRLLKQKRTICTGYAYLLQQMCELVGIEARMVHGYGKTADVDLFDLKFPNHTWNAVKLGEKWYVLDPTWATGVSIPEEDRFVFNYTEGFFLTNPEIFIKNHYPVDTKWSLLGDKIPTFQQFDQAPLLYNEAYNVLSSHSAPTNMHHTVVRNQSLTFLYTLKAPVDAKRIRFVFVNGAAKKTMKPVIVQKGNSLALKQKFETSGFYDVHLYFGEEIIATYTVRVNK